ncbi:Oidioi.mRNA.OKI2018_I69.chr1.g1730.t1.cds [Oikopleura dioica]|uniref:Oidioi.mRNA.OKI2018_I69.chr1.g1730.t1.cds n=1 Tax=Oikopleura dioica TaxID=34765 RepID=A0ABN7SPB6_OIKDI|nr:Oidioi.mRNA.OKI2018_I69.chr1.g1730.t1.cds [Oikopleura dioica]
MSVQLIKTDDIEESGNKSRKFILDEVALKKVLGTAKSDSMPIAVISIVGAYRTGKSFLQSVFYKHLAALEMGKNVWDDDEFYIEDCFKYRVQLANVTRQIDANDIANLHLFTEIGRLAIKDRMTVKPFQDFIFTVRDYEHSDEFGFEEGQELLDTIVQKQDKKIDFSDCFEDFRAFCIPHPGTIRKFDGNVKSLDKDFVENIKLLVTSIVDNIAPKRNLSDGELKIRDVFDFFKSYANIFRDGKMPTMKTIVSTNADNHYKTQLEQAKEHADKLITSHCTESCMDFKAIQNPFFETNKERKFLLPEQYDDLFRRKINEYFTEKIASALTKIVKFHEEKFKREQTRATNAENQLRSEQNNHANTKSQLERERQDHQNTRSNLDRQMREMRTSFEKQLKREQDEASKQREYLKSELNSARSSHRSELNHERKKNERNVEKLEERIDDLKDDLEETEEKLEKTQKRAENLRNRIDNHNNSNYFAKIFVPNA